MTTEVGEFEFEKSHGGVHPYKKGDRVIVTIEKANRKATVRATYWHMGYSRVDLKFDDDDREGNYSWSASRVSPMNAVDALGEIA